jgi:hypothetical protein
MIYLLPVLDVAGKRPDWSVRIVSLALWILIYISFIFLAFVLGLQANLKESSESKELAEMRLQVLVVVITSDACESKKEILRLRE